MYRLWAEWDIEEQNLIFASKEAGVRWMQANLHVEDMARDDGKTVDDWIQESFDDGLFGFVKVQVIE